MTTHPATTTRFLGVRARAAPQDDIKKALPQARLPVPPRPETRTIRSREEKFQGGRGGLRSPRRSRESAKNLRPSSATRGRAGQSGSGRAGFREASRRIFSAFRRHLPGLGGARRVAGSGGSIFDEFFRAASRSSKAGPRQASAGASPEVPEIEIRARRRRGKGHRADHRGQRAKRALRRVCSGSGAAGRAARPVDVPPFWSRARASCTSRRGVLLHQNHLRKVVTARAAVIEHPCRRLVAAAGHRRRSNAEIRGAHARPAVDTGTQVRIAGEGEPGPRGGPRGRTSTASSVVKPAPRCFETRTATTSTSRSRSGFASLVLGTKIEVADARRPRDDHAPANARRAHTVLRPVRRQGDGRTLRGGPERGDLLVTA